MTKPRIAAFFDIDGTIFRNSLLISHFNKLIQYEVFPHDLKDKIQPFYRAWSDRELDYDDYMVHVAETYTEHLRGKFVDDINFVAKQTIELEHKKLYCFTKERLKWHREQGHLIVFISGSPHFLVSRLAKTLDCDLWFASKYLSENNKYTGEVSPMWDAASKQKVLTELQQTYHIDMSQSYAYGDTTGDITLLTSVGHPTAFNPNQKLIHSLKDHDVAIVIERKDVIYQGLTTKVSRET